MELNKIRVRNFKRVPEIELPLADINILVGTNGSGKSSIIQALHLACCTFRQAEKVQPSATSTISTVELDYLPTDDYSTLGHGANWGNKIQTPSSEMSFTFSNGTEEFSALCTLRSARNSGISISGSVPHALTAKLRTKRNFFSAYIPGISGIPNREEKKSEKVTLKACSFGDSNVVLRNALHLLKERNPDNITAIENWITGIYGPISIHVDHRPSQDLYIKCEVEIDGHSKPLELVGTGFLQLIQIFSYILLFSPGVLLIDEPDIHLHPDLQEHLVAALSKAAEERGFKVIMTTHSPFIVRGAPPEANIFWLQDGYKRDNDRQAVELALGWGAFGKRAILMSEDSNTELLKKIISQWPEIDRNIAFHPGGGYSNLVTPSQAKELKETLGNRFQIIIHRDRDSLTDDEVITLKSRYSVEGTYLLVTCGSDIEAYFCTPNILSEILNIPEDESQNYIDNALDRKSRELKDIFKKQRIAHDKEIYLQGGSPTHEEARQRLAGRLLGGAKGKTVFKELKNSTPQNRFSERQILSLNLDGNTGTGIQSQIQEALDR